MRFLVAFITPKRSKRAVEMAALCARASDGEVYLLRVIPDPKKVGIVAELISSDQPIQKAKSQIAEVIGQLQANGTNATGEVRIGSVAKTLVSAAKELNAEMIFVGTKDLSRSRFSPMPKDPIVHYLVDHSPISVCLVRSNENDG